ncbi:hypothetical protein ENUP19_0156G0030 [Entamoeba nuttalli]|uniref:Glycerophosphocholine acyltransferase 1 n=2 Tax=Entamoeba nuttalli TaxID=412467 RepID=K2GBN2_ENTNP|nr:membrane transporter, putative [Entamoeba nuttalli P19]EKE39956.1 membrane transporter, putative [Entamoeba nuttalli P19]|eukprot:XP_008857705.1 membrane transporter, putative [Entamoeba nuttalli P19]
MIENTSKDTCNCNENQQQQETINEIDQSTVIDYLSLEYNMNKRLLGSSIRSGLRASKEIVKPIDEGLNKKINIVFLDKVTFVLGVALLVLSEYVFMVRVELMPVFYAFIVIPLVTARYLVYRMNKWHYFLLDFCYYTNFLLLVTTILIFGFKIISPMYEILFVLTNGPLLMAIPVWTNSLVFHDLTKLTSISIHFLPAMVTYSIRWGNIVEIPQSLSFTNGFILPMIAYSIWQTSYLIITEVFKHDLIYQEGYMTSFRWLTQEKPHKLYYFITQTLGMKQSVLFLMVLTQFIYTVITILPTFLYYKYKSLHIVWMLFCFFWAVWNGANFYFEIFLKRYNQYLDSIDKENNSSKNEIHHHTNQIPQNKNEIIINPNEQKEELLNDEQKIKND